MSRRHHQRLVRPASVAGPVLALVLALGLAACGDDDSPTDDPSGGSSGADTVSVDITRDGDTFTPNGERVDVGIDQPVTLSITSDVEGELHVHSVPEQEIEYGEGTSEHVITIDRPGVVEVESHEPDVVVLQLEVR